MIVESHSNYASPIVLVRKKSGALRMCVDYRMLNAKSQRDAHPLPRITDSIESLSNASWFSSYNQVDMADKDAHKTAYTTPYGLFQYTRITRMPFGLSNCPATFQRLMQNIFRDEMFVILLVYLDDILVFSRTLQEHLTRLETVFGILQKYGLKVQLKKCSFFRREVTYLGHRVSEDGLSTDPEKISVVKNWPHPDSKGITLVPRIRLVLSKICAKLLTNRIASTPSD